MIASERKYSIAQKSEDQVNSVLNSSKGFSGWIEGKYVLKERFTSEGNSNSDYIIDSKEIRESMINAEERFLEENAKEVLKSLETRMLEAKLMIGKLSSNAQENFNLNEYEDEEL